VFLPEALTSLFRVIDSADSSLQIEADPDEIALQLQPSSMMQFFEHPSPSS
jgi:hypothetical protein